MAVSTRRSSATAATRDPVTRATLDRVTVARVAVALLAVVLLGGCKGKRSAPVGSQEARTGIAVRDDLGRLIRLDAPARRIVSLSPALTEALFAVGCGDRVVLRDAWSDFPPAARRVPAIEGLKPGPEAIVAARPELVLANYPPPTLVAALRAAGIPLLALSPKDLAQVASGIERIARACGVEPAGAEIAGDLRAEARAVREAVKGCRRPRVFLEIDAGRDGRPYTVGRGAFGHEIIELAGGVNVFADGAKPWFAVGLEAILAADPEVMLLADAGKSGGQDVAAVASRPGWEAIRAVSAGRVHAIDADLISRPGPRLALGLREVAMMLHPGRLNRYRGHALEAFGLATAGTATR